MTRLSDRGPDSPEHCVLFFHRREWYSSKTSPADWRKLNHQGYSACYLLLPGYAEYQRSEHSNLTPRNPLNKQHQHHQTSLIIKIINYHHSTMPEWRKMTKFLTFLHRAYSRRKTTVFVRRNLSASDNAVSPSYSNPDCCHKMFIVQDYSMHENNSY